MLGAKEVKDDKFQTETLPPMLPNLMPDLDQLMRALFLVALLLYFVPAVFGMGISTEARRWFQRGAILTLGTAIAIAVLASVIWFLR